MVLNEEQNKRADFPKDKLGFMFLLSPVRVVFNTNNPTITIMYMYNRRSSFFAIATITDFFFQRS